MHEDETLLCPFPSRRIEALRLATLCQVRMGPTEKIRAAAQAFQQQANLPAKDPLHLACAVQAQATDFLTCDDALRKRAQRIQLELIIANPIDFVREETG